MLKSSKSQFLFCSGTQNRWAWNVWKYVKIILRGLKNRYIWQCDFSNNRTRTVLVTFTLNCLNLENWNFNVGYLMGDGQARWMSRFILKSLLLLTKPKWYPPQKWAPTWVECKVSSLLVVSWCCGASENRFDGSGMVQLQITDGVWTYYELQLTMWCDHWRPGPRPPAPSPRGPRHWPPGGRGPVPSCCPPLRLLWRGLKHQTGQQQTTENSFQIMTMTAGSWLRLMYLVLMERSQR